MTHERDAPASRRRFSLLWLIVALPLLGGRGPAARPAGARDRWGHLARHRGPAGVVRAVRRGRSSRCSAKPDDQRFVDQHLYSWIFAGRLHVDVGLYLDPLSVLLPAAHHRRRLADPHLLDRLHGARPRPAPLLRLPQPVRRRDAPAGPRRQLRSRCTSAGRASASPRTCSSGSGTTSGRTSPRRPRRRSSSTGSATSACRIAILRDVRDVRHGVDPGCRGPGPAGVQGRR